MPKTCCGAVGGAKVGDPSSSTFTSTYHCGSNEPAVSILLPLHGIMVVFVDFEDEAEDAHVDPSAVAAGFALPGGSQPFPDQRPIVSTIRTGQRTEPVELTERPNPNINALSEALGCYPYA